MRFGTSIPSRVQIPPPPRLITEAPVHPTGASSFPPRPESAPTGSFPRSQGLWITDFTGRRQSCNVLPVAASGPKGPGAAENKTSTRSLTDRASDYGSEGCRFESCRVHTGERPRRDPGPLAFQGRTAAQYSNRGPRGSAGSRIGCPRISHGDRGVVARVRHGRGIHEDQDRRSGTHDHGPGGTGGMRGQPSRGIRGLGSSCFRCTGVGASPSLSRGSAEPMVDMGDVGA